jgi:hypothetical protein
MINRPIRQKITIMLAAQDQKPHPLVTEGGAPGGNPS